MLQTFVKFFRFAGEQRIRWVKGILFAVVHSLFDSLQIVAILVVLRGIVQGTMSTQTIGVAFLIMLVVIFGSAVSLYISQLNEIKGSYYMCSSKRIEIGERMKFMPLGYFKNQDLGRLTSAVTTTMEEIEKLAPPVMVKTIHGLIRTLIMAVFVAVLDWRIGLLVALGIILFFLVNRQLHKRSKLISPKRQAAQMSLVGAAIEYVQGMSVVKAFKLDKNANIAIKKTIKEVEKYNYSMELQFISLMALQQVVLRVFGILMIFASVVVFLAGQMTLVTALAIIICSFFVYADLETAGSLSSFLRLVDASIDIVEDIFQTPVMDEKGTIQSPENFSIEVQDIYFSYDKKPIINGISLSIPEGSVTAIVGPSGGGKSTFCHLLARFWDVDKGSISLGGIDIREFKLNDLMSHFSMVFQNVYLFDDTIENNIKFGKPDATGQEVIEAAKKASCHEFILSLKDGYQTRLGEGGATISGGEKQRISIARAILKDAPIVILDEATASVDPENESQLQEAIQELTKGKSLIMIAHRLKTVKEADQIVVIEGGEIVQKGSHQELIGQSGLYADFINVRKRAVGWKL